MRTAISLFDRENVGFGLIEAALLILLQHCVVVLTHRGRKRAVCGGYTTVPGKISKLLAKIREVGVPPKVTNQWLKTIGLADEAEFSTPDTKDELQMPAGPLHAPVVPPSAGAQVTQPGSPSLHIDIQVHISPEAPSDQIDQIFASMAKHLYGAKK